MEVFVSLKSVGKRKKGIEKIAYILPDDITTLRDLIEAVVSRETAAYNDRGADNRLMDFLTEAKIEDKATAGKVDFGRLYSENRANPEKAVATALQGFTDGLFRVLVNEKEATELDAPLAIGAGNTLTFIRLTFLTGRLW